MTVSAKSDETTQSPFLAIERDWAGLKDLVADKGAYLAEGLLWRTSVSTEVARLAARARAVCGAERPWSEVVEIAEYAGWELDLRAEKLADDWRRAIAESTMTATSVILVHGPAEILAWGLLWSLNNPETGTALKDRPVPPAIAITSSQTLAAFALLMIDHAVYDMSKGRSVTALELLSIGGSALAYATMDKAQSDAAKQLFNERSARGLAGAKGKWSSISEHQTDALRMANEGRYKSRIDAARTIAQNLVKASPAGKDEFYTVETIDGWLKKAGWKATL